MERTSVWQFSSPPSTLHSLPRQHFPQSASYDRNFVVAEAVGVDGDDAEFGAGLGDGDGGGALNQLVQYLVSRASKRLLVDGDIEHRHRLLRAHLALDIAVGDPVQRRFALVKLQIPANGVGFIRASGETFQRRDQPDCFLASNLHGASESLVWDAGNGPLATQSAF